MAYAVRLQQFEGPLNLLLELIEQEKLDVTQLALATVTDSFLAYLEQHPEIPPEELTDFLVIASRLLLIKSRLLLPYLQTQQDEDGEQDLEAQLKMFKYYLDASKLLEKMIAKRRFLFVHEKLPKTDIGFAPPLGFTAGAMHELFRATIERLTPIVRPPTVQTMERNVSIHDKIRSIRDAIARASRLSFRELVASAESRTEVIVSFLALLELVKQRQIIVAQDARFSDIVISRFATAQPNTP